MLPLAPAHGQHGDQFIKAKSRMARVRHLFGTDGIRGTANTDPMTAETALRLGQAAGLLFTRGSHRHKGGDRQGHATVGLHGGACADRRVHRRRDGRDAGRAAADAGHRHADAQPARRPGRDDLRLAQPVRGQRHQAVRPGRLQAGRCDGTRDRGADGRRPARAAGGPRRHSAAPPGWRMPPAATSRPPRRVSLGICASTT